MPYMGEINELDGFEGNRTGGGGGEAHVFKTLQALKVRNLALHKLLNEQIRIANVREQVEILEACHEPHTLCTLSRLRESA